MSAIASTDATAAETVPAPSLPEEATLLAGIRDRFDTLRRLVVGVVDGHQHSVIMSGAPGVGKTWTVDSTLGTAESYSLVNKVSRVSGVIGALGFYLLLWENRRAGDVVVLDDADALFATEEGCNLIKAATDSGRKRVVSYMREAHATAAAGKSFVYEGAVIVATNLDLPAEARGKNRMAPHIAAVLNRALYLDVGLRTGEALMARVVDVCRNTPMLRDAGADDRMVEAAVAWLRANGPDVRSLSLRTALRLVGLMLSEPETWGKTAAATLLHAPADR